MPKLKERSFKGLILSRGIGFGRPIFIDSENIFDQSIILEKDVRKEIFKFKKAIKESKKQILQMKKSLSKDNVSITFDILNTHLEILNDPLITTEIVHKIRKNKKNIETIFNEFVLEYKNKIKDPFFKEKALDLEGIFKRILKNIRSIKVGDLKNISSKSIALCKEVIPSDVFEIDKKKIKAFISLSGSYESHAAIIARSKHIPFLSQIDIEKLKNINFKDMIVDAYLGKIIINPSKTTYKKYEKLQRGGIKQESDKEKIKLTKKVQLYANISNLKEVDLLIENKLFGIGLLRTEFLFLKNKKLPSEAMQFKVYKEIAQKLKKQPFIIRLFDLGGDKSFYNVSEDRQKGFLGHRGVEFLLNNKKILKNQIRAILKASSFGNIYILLPFIRDVEEIKKIKQEIVTCQKELKKFNIKIGSMIETPAAALMAEEIAKEIDFMSIGSNDLTRYTFASQNWSFDSLHPSLVKLIQMIIKASKAHKKPTFLCGEMVANKKILNKLISLGITKVSVGIKHLDLFH